MIDEGPDSYIKQSLESGLSVEQVKLFGASSYPGAVEILDELIDDGWDENFTLESWSEYVDTYMKVNPIPIEIESATLGDILGEIDLNQLINNPNSSWMALRTSFANNGISSKSIREIESSAHSVLQCLAEDTRQREPIKGLVFGSVQSGKTANMEALISMAADTYWNIFIILTGTIESLRIQTRDRFRRDLKNTTSISWRHIDLSGEDRRFTTTSMSLNAKGDFTHGSRYVITCLKQKSRLKKLIEWLYADKDQARRMRVIVIDDEADQASINTAPILDGEDREEYEQARKEINRLIVCLANGLLSDGSEPPIELQAMNYISYTATPYANVLNEPPGESLYPKDFVHSLSAPDEYFGINVIFGNNEYVDDDGNPLAPGLDIIRQIPDNDADDIKLSHKESRGAMPPSMKNSICWFLCCAAVLRHNGHHKPISMLVHTSNKGIDHDVDYALVHSYLTKTSPNVILDECREIYAEECPRFTFDDLARDFSSYGLLSQVRKDLPSFEDISQKIGELINEVGNITFAGNEELRYVNGINICIDNCFSDRSAPENVKMRLVYPSSSQLASMSKAPVFIVIGGNTLARGLTIEGLVCTFFARNTSQADTLMQMARWFGYRKGYELLQRVWLTDEITQKYRALSKVEMNLKEEIKRFAELGMRPDQLGVKVRTMPEVRKFMLSAKNKMQSANPCEFNFTGYSFEVTEFDSSVDKLKRNIDLTERFLTDASKNHEVTAGTNAVVWKNIATADVLEYISEYDLSEHSSVTPNDLLTLSNWIKNPDLNQISSWNVAVAGKMASPSGPWSCPGTPELPRVERTKLLKHQNYIDVGSLRSGADALCDIDEGALTPEQKRILNDGGRNANAIAKRAMLGMEDTPLLLIYRIDAASERKTKTRCPIGTQCDIISFSVIIPGDKHGSNGVKAVSILLNKE